MVTTNLNLSMNNPEVVQIHAKQGDSGRLYKVNIKDASEENGTLRILRPDGVEVTADAIKSAGGDAYKGDLVTFTALEEVPLTKLEVGLSSSQDLHGQSNPYPSGGGVNKFDGVAEVGTINSGSGGNLNDDTRFRSTNYVPISPSTTYYAYCGTAYTSGRVAYYDTNKAYISDAWNVLPTNGTFTTVANAYYMRFTYVGTYNNDVSINYPSTVTTYSPYSNICPIVPSNGKNLLQNTATTDTISNVAFTVNADGSVVANGTASALAEFVINDALDLTDGVVYTLTGSPPNADTSKWKLRVYNSNDYIDVGGGVNFTFASGSSVKKCSIVVYSGTHMDNVKFYPMIRLASDVNGTYAPYQGIGVNLCGKNLFDSNVSTLINVPITLYGTSDGTVVNFLNTLDIGNYYLSFKETIDTRNGTSQHNYYGVIIANSATSNIVIRNDVSNPSQGDTFSFDSAIVINETNVGKFTNFWYYCGRATAEGTDTCIFHDFQLEYGDEPTPYEPYNGTTHSISLGRSVYGGYVDLVSGKLTVTHGMIDLETYADATPLPSPTYPRWKYTISDLKPTATGGEYPHAIAEQYRGVTSNQYNYVYGTFYNAVGLKTIEIVNMDSDNRPQGKLVYELDTPQEYDLTPTQISTLLGENNVWSSGEVEVAFEYDKPIAQLPQQATAVVGRCIGDVNFTNVSTMPFTLNVIPNNQEETP